MRLDSRARRRRLPIRLDRAPARRWDRSPRRAAPGTRHAASATARSRAAAAPTYDGRSVGSTPKRSERISQCRDRATARVPSASPAAGRGKALTHDQPQQVAQARAERRPDAELTPAQRHRVRQHAVEADRRQRQREAGEHGDDRRRRSVATRSTWTGGRPACRSRARRRRDPRSRTMSRKAGTICRGSASVRMTSSMLPASGRSGPASW